MALSQLHDARIEYTGNGSETNYTHHFEYNERKDVAVAYWDEDRLAWKVQPDSDWEFLNDTTIQFNEAPVTNNNLLSTVALTWIHYLLSSILVILSKHRI